jgi:hypothetical protein
MPEWSRNQRHQIKLEVEFMALPGERIPLPDASVDTVVCTVELAKSGVYAFQSFLYSWLTPVAQRFKQEPGGPLKPYTRRRARRDVNHNFQPQRSHLNRSSGFSLEAVLPQRGHFIVHIWVKGPSGVTLKIWMDSTVASSNRHLIGIRRDAIRFPCISGSTTLMEKLA